jgi:hypothetical protein
MEERNKDALEKMEKKNEDSMRMIQGLMISFEKSEKRVEGLEERVKGLDERVKGME